MRNFIIGVLIGLCFPVAAELGQFAAGFKQGVRYGMLALMENPKEDSILNLTKRAAEIYLELQAME